MSSSIYLQSTASLRGWWNVPPVTVFPITTFRIGKSQKRITRRRTNDGMTTTVFCDIRSIRLRLQRPMSHARPVVNRLYRALQFSQSTQCRRVYVLYVEWPSLFSSILSLYSTVCVCVQMRKIAVRRSSAKERRRKKKNRSPLLRHSQRPLKNRNVMNEWTVLPTVFSPFQTTFSFTFFSFFFFFSHHSLFSFWSSSNSSYSKPVNKEKEHYPSLLVPPSCS